MTNSYFKSGKQFVFFDDNDRDDVERAFELISAFEGVKTSVFRPIRFVGPWDRVGLVGHRTRPDILAEMKDADSATLPGLQYELAQLEEAYRKVGRDVPGTLKVAA